jgi:PEGA domain
MSHKTLWKKKLQLTILLLLPAALQPQMPPQSGRLVISSQPTGAIVTINGKEMGQHTNATFVVSSGNYRVSVASADGSLHCTEIILSVSGGQTVGRTCTAKGWE